MPHRVSYGETDTMGVLYYAEYLHLFERARSAYIRSCGMSYADVEKKGIILPGARGPVPLPRFGAL